MKITKRTYIIIISVAILLSGVYFGLEYTVQQMFKGETNDELSLLISRDLLDSSRIGIERFKSKNGHYPEISGKYFVDSIKPYIKFHEAYIYYDSISANGQIIQKGLALRNYLKTSNTYLGAGFADMTIIYRPISNNSYQLYSVGLNLKDEDGKGDDINL